MLVVPLLLPLLLLCVKASEVFRQKILSLPRDCTLKNIAGLPSIDFDKVPYEKLVYAFQAFDNLLENLHSTPLEDSLKGMDDHTFMLKNILEYVQRTCAPSDSVDTPTHPMGKNEGATETISPQRENAESQTDPIKANMEKKPDILTVTSNDLPDQNESKETKTDPSTATPASEATQGEASTTASKDDKKVESAPTDALQQAKSEDDQAKKTIIKENPFNAPAAKGDAQLLQVPAHKEPTSTQTTPNVDVQMGKSTESDKKAVPAPTRQTPHAGTSPKDTTIAKGNQTKTEADAQKEKSSEANMKTAPAPIQQTAQSGTSTKEATSVKGNQPKSEGDKTVLQSIKPKVESQPVKDIPHAEKTAVKVEPVKKESVAKTQTSQVKPSIIDQQKTASEDSKKPTSQQAKPNADDKKVSPSTPLPLSPEIKIKVDDQKTKPAAQISQAVTLTKIFTETKVNQTKPEGSKTASSTSQQMNPKVEPQPTKVTTIKVEANKKEATSTAPNSQVKSNINTQRVKAVDEDKQVTPSKPLEASPNHKIQSKPAQPMVSEVKFGEKVALAPTPQTMQVTNQSNGNQIITGSTQKTVGNQIERIKKEQTSISDKLPLDMSWLEDIRLEFLSAFSRKVDIRKTCKCICDDCDEILQDITKALASAFGYLMDLQYALANSPPPVESDLELMEIKWATSEFRKNFVQTYCRSPSLEVEKRNPKELIIDLWKRYFQEEFLEKLFPKKIRKKMRKLPDQWSDDKFLAIQEVLGNSCINEIFQYFFPVISPKKANIFTHGNRCKSLKVTLDSKAITEIIDSSAYVLTGQADAYYDRILSCNGSECKYFSKNMYVDSNFGRLPALINRFIDVNTCCCSSESLEKAYLYFAITDNREKFAESLEKAYLYFAITDNREKFEKILDKSQAFKEIMKSAKADIKNHLKFFRH